MIVKYNDDLKSPECLISNTALALNKLGQDLQTMSESRFYKSEQKDTEGFYNTVLMGVSFVIEDDDSDKIALNLNEGTFVISGNKIAISDLGESLTNIFNDDTKAGAHLHLSLIHI